MELDLRDLARRGLQAAVARLDADRAHLLDLLAQLDGTPRAARPAPVVRRPRRMSPEGRQRIQEAVRRRWERQRAAQAGAASSTAETPVTEASTPAASARARRSRRATTPRSGGRKK